MATLCCIQGDKRFKVEICSGQKCKAGDIKSGKRKHVPSGLEPKLDELRKELSSIHGGIFPHSVLSSQQISVLSEQRPSSMEQANLCYLETVIVLPNRLSLNLERVSCFL